MSITTGGLFQFFFVFIPIWGRFPIWLIFFRGIETTDKNCFGKNMVICSSILRCVPRLQPAPVSFCPFGDHLNVLVTSWVIQFGAQRIWEVEGEPSKDEHFFRPITEVKDPPKEIGIGQCVPMLISSAIYGLLYVHTCLSCESPAVSVPQWWRICCWMLIWNEFAIFILLVSSRGCICGSLPDLSNSANSSNYCVLKLMTFGVFGWTVL